MNLKFNSNIWIYFKNMNFPVFSFQKFECWKKNYFLSKYWFLLLVDAFLCVVCKQGNESAWKHKRIERNWRKKRSSKIRYNYNRNYELWNLKGKIFFSLRIYFVSKIDCMDSSFKFIFLLFVTFSIDYWESHHLNSYFYFSLFAP